MCKELPTNVLPLSLKQLGSSLSTLDAIYDVARTLGCILSLLGPPHQHYAIHRRHIKLQGGGGERIWNQIKLEHMISLCVREIVTNGISR